MRACISAVDFLNMAKMKRKVLKVMATLILFGLVVNFVASRKAKHGLRVQLNLLLSWIPTKPTISSDHPLEVLSRSSRDMTTASPLYRSTGLSTIVKLPTRHSFVRKGVKFGFDCALIPSDLPTILLDLPTGSFIKSLRVEQFMRCKLR